MLMTVFERGSVVVRACCCEFLGCGCLLMWLTESQVVVCKLTVLCVGVCVGCVGFEFTIRPSELAVVSRAGVGDLAASQLRRVHP